jgi:hypothetical protein
MTAHLELCFGPNGRFVTPAGTSLQIIKFDIVCLKIETDHVAQAIVYVHGPDDGHDKGYLKVTDGCSKEGFVHALEVLWNKVQGIHEIVRETRWNLL